jgi:hypothetical protein
MRAKQTMKKYEYHTQVIDTKGLFGGKIDAAEFNQFLNEMGQQGWELIEATASNQAYGGTGYLICIFKREIADTQ